MTEIENDNLNPALRYYIHIINGGVKGPQSLGETSEPLEYTVHK